MIELMFPDVKVFDYCSEDVIVPMPTYVTSSKEDSNSLMLEVDAEQMLEYGNLCSIDKTGGNDILDKLLDWDKYEHEMDLHVINNSYNTYIPHVVNSQKIDCSHHHSQNCPSHFHITMLIEHVLNSNA